MSKVVEGKVVKEGFVGWNGWEENIFLENEDLDPIEEALREFEGKKVRVTIEVLE